jgi:hypothetical protein
MAKKMLLIDPRLLESMTQKQYVPPDALPDNLGDLDNQMHHILHREDLHVHDKAKLYQQNLRRYLNQLALYRNKPLDLLDVNPPPTLPTSPLPPLHSPPSLGIESLQSSTLSERVLPTQPQTIGVVPVPTLCDPVTSPSTSVHKEPDNDKSQQLPPNKNGEKSDRSASEYSFRSRKRSKSKPTLGEMGKNKLSKHY